MRDEVVGKSTAGPKVRLVKIIACILMIGFVLVEARAKFGYSQAISGLDELLEKSAAEGKIDAVEGTMLFFPSKSLVAEGATSNLYIYSWASLLNYGGYKISLYYSKDEPPRMLKFKMGQGTLGVVKPMSKEEATPQSEGGISFGNSDI